DFTIEGLLAILGVQADAIGAQRIVLDALDTLLRVFPSPDRVREEFIRLHDWLRNRAATAILTVKTNEQGRPIHRHLDFLVDCVLYLDQRIDGQVRTRRLRVVKYRGSGFLSNEYPYVISSNGVVLIPVSSASLMHRALGDRIPS